MANLTLPKLLIILCGLGALLMIQPEIAAADDDEDENQHETYILYFRPTQNAPPGASGKMKISVDASRGDTRVKFSVRHAYPNTLSRYCEDHDDVASHVRRRVPAFRAGPPLRE